MSCKLLIHWEVFLPVQNSFVLFSFRNQNNLQVEIIITIICNINLLTYSDGGIGREGGWGTSWTA